MNEEYFLLIPVHLKSLMLKGRCFLGLIHGTSDYYRNVAWTCRAVGKFNVISYAKLCVTGFAGRRCPPIPILWLTVYVSWSRRNVSCLMSPLNHPLTPRRTVLLEHPFFAAMCFMSRHHEQFIRLVLTSILRRNINYQEA